MREVLKYSIGATTYKNAHLSIGLTRENSQNIGHQSLAPDVSQRLSS